MVTIYDMLSGEQLHSDSHPSGAQDAHQPAPTLIAPRLQTVAEAAACEARPRTMPADMQHMDLHSFLARQ